ncbi:hypothetical protein P3W45_001863 [Vairimorpha bombi]
MKINDNLSTLYFDVLLVISEQFKADIEHFTNVDLVKYLNLDDGAISLEDIILISCLYELLIFWKNELSFNNILFSKLISILHVFYFTTDNITSDTKVKYVKTYDIDGIISDNITNRSSTLQLSNKFYFSHKNNIINIKFAERNYIGNINLFLTRHDSYKSNTQITDDLFRIFNTAKASEINLKKIQLLNQIKVDNFGRKILNENLDDSGGFFYFIEILGNKSLIHP